MSVERGFVLVDTSIWIEILRHPSPSVRPFIDILLAENQARLCAAVAAELIQGATTSKDLEAAEELYRTVPVLLGNDDTWIAAGRLSQKLRSKGVTIGLLDCYLSELALEHHCSIFSLDKHFPLIAKHTPLELFSTTDASSD